MGEQNAGHNEEETTQHTQVGVSHLLDLVVWALWVVLVWGFIGTLALTESSKDSPGVHEVIILAYFLGFSLMFALVYFIAMKKGA